MARDNIHGIQHLYEFAENVPIAIVASAIVFGVASSDDADETVFPLETNVLVNSVEMISKAGSGELRLMLEDIYAQQPAAVIVVRVADNSDADVLASNIIGGIDNETNGFTGMQLALSAEGDLGMIPRIFLAQNTSNLSVGIGLSSIAKKLGGVPVIDGNSDGLSAAIQDKNQYSDAIFVDNGALKLDKTVRPASPTVVGAIVRNDMLRGYHTSPSNQAVLNVLGPAKAVDYARGSSTSLANILSSNDICTLVNKNGGTVFWGNRLANGTLIPHHRLRYIIGDSIAIAHEEYIDRNLTSDYISFVKDRVNAVINLLVLQRRLSGGECWVNVELNKASLPTNAAYWDYKLGFYNVAETMFFRQYVTDEYTNDIIDQIAA